MTSKHAIVSGDQIEQDDYEAMCKRGVDPKLAEMLATQTPPGLQTDTRFLHGQSENGFYSHQLESWVSTRADVKRICQEKNYDCEGSVSHKSVDRLGDDEKPYKVADDLVENAVRDTLIEHPDALLDEPALVEKTRERLTGDG